LFLRVSPDSGVVQCPRLLAGLFTGLPCHRLKKRRLRSRDRNLYNSASERQKTRTSRRVLTAVPPPPKSRGCSIYR
jgi:hypothetical protein